MSDTTQPKPRTLGELRTSGYKVRSVRQEMRANLLQALTDKRPILPGIIGYEESVVPEIENAILAGHHLIILGERGQAKSRIIRGLTSLLDPETAIIAGCEINDNPYAPICQSCRRRVETDGDAIPLAWITPSDRYGEKLATPDVSIADLIGEIDPIKVAEGRYLADEETIHYGLVPRTNRGIFAINELPDLTERVQVGLFNLMEERDVQIKGFKVRLPIDVVIIATANPEDYTSRGRIITPLKDRFDAQIRAHYPQRIEDEITIMQQEAAIIDRAPRAVRVPDYMKEIVARLSFEARTSNEINQTSGVSVRLTINNYESLLANAEKRAVRLQETEVVPRLTDIHAMLASTSGKIELEYVGEDKKPEDLVERLINRAIRKVFDAHLKLEDLSEVIAYFQEGGGVEISDMMRAQDYVEGVRGISGMRKAIEPLAVGESPGLMAAATEFVLEGLHLHQKLNKERDGGRLSYRA
jgi:magnesium chelatase subunit I